MAGRGSQSFMKRQKEQQRKERQQEKFAKRMERKHAPKSEEDDQIQPAAETGPIPEQAPEA